ncbi:PAS domain S-box protein [uncultured Desulfosarcina sp.]|uniref:sensor histidine kinase n=1 Tax=uncultured Desulfosarcina sp. TaxID=218289 RepID=UPI0029C73056|nr:PAS domain S-box protein [uncultured Desulfosarcina sp.]
MTDVPPNSDPPGIADDIFRDRFRVFLEDVADGFYETDLKGNFRFFNNALCRIFGYTAAEIQGRNFSEFMDAENALYAFTLFNRLYEAGEIPSEIIWKIIRKDGQERILEISVSLIVDRSGKKTGFQGVARDVTQKIADQQELEASQRRAQELFQSSFRAEQRYRAFLEFLPDPVFVFNMDSTVSYLNPAFEKVFGWTLTELEGKRIPFVPDSEKDRTRAGIKKLFREKVLHGFETRRFTKDGRVLDIVVDGAIFYDAEDNPAGQVITLRDVTARKRAEQINQALFRIAQALYRFPGLDRMLEYITRQVQELIRVAGAMVILIDEQEQEFYIPVAAYEDGKTGSKMKEIRFPMDKGVAGHVYRTGEPLIVSDTAKSLYFYDQVDKQAQFHTKNMLDVPLRIQERMIGVLCAVNKTEGAFDSGDVDLLGAVANLVALPIENARINEALQRAYENVRGLNRAKEQVIHHLSHELKTPLSVLSASLGLLEKRLPGGPDKALEKIMARARRNLQRLLDMQYEIGDMLREQDYRAHGMLSFLLEACRDMLVTLAEAQPGSTRVPEVIQQAIDREFGRAEIPCTDIALDQLVKIHLELLKPRFAHRYIQMEIRLEPVAPVLVPAEVMEKIVEGLVKNAIENTPDQGRVTVVVRTGEKGPVFEVQDTGVGVTAEKQQMIFNHYFATGDAMNYASKAPYDFNAGGRGFDLLRISIFSERYRFDTKMISRRCRYIPSDRDLCPGAINRCNHCSNPADCDASGGTTMQIRFLPSNQVNLACRLGDGKKINN